MILTALGVLLVWIGKDPVFKTATPPVLFLNLEGWCIYERVHQVSALFSVHLSSSVSRSLPE